MKRGNRYSPTSCASFWQKPGAKTWGKKLGQKPGEIQIEQQIKTYLSRVPTQSPTMHPVGWFQQGLGRGQQRASSIRQIPSRDPPLLFLHNPFMYLVSDPHFDHPVLSKLLHQFSMLQDDVMSTRCHRDNKRNIAVVFMSNRKRQSESSKNLQQWQYQNNFKMHSSKLHPFFHFICNLTLEISV